MRPENHLQDSQCRWFAIYTRYKCEKFVVRKLQEQGIEAYVPLQQKIRRYASKVKKVELPLLSCYVFVWITKKEYIRVLRTEHVVGFVKIANNLLAIPEREIEILRRVAGDAVPVEVEKKSYLSGDRVEIIGGHLTGLQGVFRSQKSKNSFVIELEHLGVALSMEVDPKLLIKVE